MTEAALEPTTDGFRVCGELVFETVVDLLERGEPLLRQGGCLEVDLSKVSATDSAGLALLIEWMRIAQESGTELHYHGVPEQLMALASISDLDDILIDVEAPSRAA